MHDSLEGEIKIKSCQDHLDLMNAIEGRDLKKLEKITKLQWGMEFFENTENDGADWNPKKEGDDEMR